MSHKKNRKKLEENNPFENNKTHNSRNDYDDLPYEMHGDGENVELPNPVDIRRLATRRFPADYPVQEMAIS